MADQQRKVSLIFEANASQAKNEINDLVASLQKIQATPATLIDSKGIKEASKAALELQSHLQKAVNTDTGKLDLNRFANSLSSSGKSLEQYRNTLTKIGPAGNTAFKSLLTSINNAEASTVRLTKGMRDFITTMKNTVKWQISSSMMHGLMSAIQNANSYAQQLDRSLNDIRIVSGASAEEMARFAVEANRAAQALSTTTTKYTDAALIFYQQGLNDQQVKERTEAVIKMANVTGEASKDVSSYMTAIWNNFADGSKSLEYYADVITKLGAATAASSEEIAGGLEKFAAIGNTIGLSYEYATSMITTIVDKTRQSEDVVGTALKTILARIQGLNLGETLEDGTTLNKYSGALEKVGINIKDASGQLKDMDIILDELGSKWGTFSKDTQVALAQVVGGVRQYNQIISLMNNWDSFQKNVQIAEGSTGSLNEQADIYAESWEAARNRVKAATQGIYDALLDEKVFIQLDDIFTHLLNGINGVVQGMGGMVPILGTIGGFITQKFAKEMPVALGRMSQNIAILTGKAQNKAADWQAGTTRQAELARDASIGDAKAEAEYETIRRVSAMREQLLRNQHQMNSEEIEHYESLIRNEEAIGRIVEARAEAFGLLERETQELKDQVALRTAIEERERATDFTREDRNSEKWDEAERQALEDLDKRIAADNERLAVLKGKAAHERSFEEEREMEEISNRNKQFFSDPVNRKGYTADYFQVLDAKTQDIFTKKAKEQATAIVDVSSALKQAQIAQKEFGNFMEDMKLDEGGVDVKEFEEKLKSLRTTMGNINADTSQIDDIITQLGNASEVEKPQIEAVTRAIEEMVQAKEKALKQTQEDARGYNIGEDDIKVLTKQGQKEGEKASGATDRGEIPEVKPHVTKSVEALTSAMGSLMSAYSAVQAVASAWDTVMDKNATTMEKTGAIIGALMSITMAFNSILELNTTLKGLQSIQEKKSIIHKMGDAFATRAQTAANKGNTNSIWANIAAWKIWQASNPVGWILAIVGAVVALGVALSKIDWRTDEEKKLDKLKDRSKALSQAQEDLSQKISDVESAWSNYQDMVTALQECTTGTEDWNNALRDVNQSVLDILKTAPHLAQYVQYDSNGMAYIGGAEYEAYLAEQKRESQLIGAEQAITTTEISDIENQAYLFGSEAQQKALMAFWAEFGDISSWQNNSQFSITEIFAKLLNDVFLGDTASFEKYLKSSGLNNAFEGQTKTIPMGGGTYTPSVIETLNNSAYYGSSLTYKEGVSVSDLTNEWSEALAVQTSNQVQRDIAYRSILETESDYNADNINAYGDVIARLVEQEEGAVASWEEDALLRRYEEYGGYNPNELSIKNGQVYDKAGNEIEGLTEEALRAAVALGNVTRNSDTLGEIITEVNTLAANSTELGRELLTSAGDLSKVGINTQVSAPEGLENNPFSSLVLSEERATALSELENSRTSTIASLNEVSDILGNTTQASIIAAERGRAARNAIEATPREPVDPSTMPSYERLQTARAEYNRVNGLYNDPMQLSTELGYAREQTQNAQTEIGLLEADLTSQREWLDSLIEKRDAFNITDYTQAIADQENVVAEAINTLTEMDPLYAAMQRTGVAPETIYMEKMAGVDFVDSWGLDAEGDGAILNNAKAVDIQKRLNPAFMYGNPEMEAQMNVVAEEQAELERLRGEAEKSAKAQAKLAKINEDIAEQEALILSTEQAIELANANLAASLEQEQILNDAVAELEAVQDELDAATAAVDAEVEAAELAIDLQQDQASWDAVVAAYEEMGLALPEELKTLGENLSYSDAIEQAAEYIANTAIPSLQDQQAGFIAQLGDLEATYESTIEGFLTEYFESLGLSLEDFLNTNTDYTLQSLFNGVQDLENNPELLTDLTASSYLMRYPDLFEGSTASNEEIVAQGKEYDARDSLLTMLMGENHGLELNDATFEYIKEMYNLTGDTATEAIEYLMAELEVAKTRATQEWNKYLGNGYELNYNSETGYEGAGENLKSFQTAETQNYDTTQISAMAKLLGDAKSLMSTEDFLAFDDLFSTMLNTSQDFNGVMAIMEQARSKMMTLGRQLTVDEVAAILEENNTSAEDLGVTLEDLTEGLNDTISAATLAAEAFDNLTSSLGLIKGNLNGLTRGTILDKDAWAEIKDTIPEEFRDLFLQNAEGGATFIGDEEQGKRLYQESLLTAGTNYMNAVSGLESARTTVMGESNELVIDDSTKVAGADLTLENIQAWMEQQGQGTYEGSNLQTILQALGKENDYQAAMADGGITNSSGELNEVGSTIANAILTVLSGNSTNPDEASQVLATSGADRYTVEQWNEDGLFTDSGHYEYARSEAIRGEYAEVGVSTEDLEKQIELLEELGETTGKTESEITELAGAQVRWNRSVEAADKGLEDWKKQIKTVTKDSLGDFEDSLEDVQGAYEDLLDVDPGSLSKEFLTSADNLELYEKAINGSEEALKEFQALAADDIYTLNADSADNFITTFEDVIDESGQTIDLSVGVDEASWDSTLSSVIGYIDEMNSNSVITPEIEAEALANINGALEQLKFNTREAAMAASESLSAIGVDAEVVEKSVDVPANTIVTKQSGTFTNVKTVEGEEIQTETLQIEGESTITEEAHKQSYYVLEGKGFTPGAGSGGASTGSGGTRGGGRPRRGGGGGRRGGGGGRRAPTAEKKKDSEKERYHTITNVLEDLTDAYDKVSKASDRAFGKARVKLLEQQEEALVDLMEAQEDYLDEIEANLKKDMDLIKSMDFGVELQFDKNGTLLNFEELQNAMWDEYNSHINDKGEVIGMTDEEWKEYEEKWQERMEALAQYEETQDLWKEAQQQLQDYINQIKDVRLEQVTYAVEVDIEASENALEILEYLLEKIGDSAWDAAEAIANMGEQAQEYLGDLKVNEDGSTTFVGGQIETYRQGIAGILGNHTTKVGENDTTITQAEIEGFMNGDVAAIEKVKQMGLDGTLTDAEVQSLKDYHSQLLAANQALMDLRDNVHGKVLEAFQQFNDELQEGIDAIVHLGAMMQSYRNIVDIVGKENLGVTNTMLEAIGQAGVENKIDTLGGQKARVDSLRAMIADAEAKAASATTEEDKEKWKENIEEMKKDLADAEEDFMGSWEEALQSIQEQFELAVFNTIETFSDALAGPLAGSLDELQASFDRQNSLAERFLPEYEKIYELNKLNRDITNSINDTDNVKAKQELAKLQEEINTLEAEGTEVSRFQTEDLRRRYELKLAELALEEAKNAKSNVQMARNADGDWSYVYTADEEDVAAAEQNYEDKMFAIQQANAQYINEMQNSLIQAQADMASEIEAIMADETLSMEEKMQKVNEIKEYYTEMFGYYSDELQYVMDQNGTAFEDTTLSALTGFQDLESYNQNFYDATTAMMTDLDEAYAMWEENTEAAMEAAGTSIDGFADHLSEQTQAMVDDSNEARESVENLGQAAVDAFGDITTAVENWVTQYGEKISEIITKNEALATSFKNLLNEWSNFDNKDNQNPAPTEPEPTDPGGDDDGGGDDNDEPEYMGQITIKKGYQYWGYKSPKGGSKNKVKVVNDDRQERTYKFTQMDTSTSRKRVYIPSEKVWVSSYDPDGPKRIKVEKFDTGGYTGSWGSEGRMAMLHEKEIVLNKADTANLLTAVDMIRQVAKIIDLNAYSSAGFGSSIMGIASGSAGQFEQNVHITAEFPNATDRNEIYAAFTDIVNLASQYANR